MFGLQVQILSTVFVSFSHQGSQILSANRSVSPKNIYRNPFDLLAVTNLASQREKALFR
jgi:hypothetical protein